MTELLKNLMLEDEIAKNKIGEDEVDIKSSKRDKNYKHWHCIVGGIEGRNTLLRGQK